MSLPFSDSIKIIDSVSSTKTTNGYDVSKRQQVTIEFTCDTYSSGSGTYTIDASNDGVNWVTGIAFLDAIQTTIGTFVTSKQLSSETSAGAYVMSGWKMLRVVCTISGTGTYSAIIQNAG